MCAVFQGSMVVYAMWNLAEQVKRKSNTVISTVITFIITLSGFQCLAADIQYHRMQNSRCCCLCSWELYFSICVHKWDQIIRVKNKVCLKLNAWVQLWFWDSLILLCLLLFCLFSFWHWQKNSLFALDATFLWCCSVKCRGRQEVIFYWEAEVFFIQCFYIGQYTMLVLTLRVYHLFPASCSSSTLKKHCFWHNRKLESVWYLKLPAMSRS